MNIKISHHLLLCTSPKKEQTCCDPSTGRKSWSRLKEIIKELELESPNRKEGIVLRSKVECLRICKRGPILLVWPDGIWYARVSPELIELIVRQHIILGRPISKFILKVTPFINQPTKDSFCKT